MDIKVINEQFSACAQIAASDIPALVTAGYVAIINNRPDGESPDQPPQSDIETAAKAAGLPYYFLPVGRDGLSPELIAQTEKIIEEADGPVFAFCRTGTRSTTVWALSQGGKITSNEIISAAAGGGYDVSHLRAHLER